MSVNCKSFFSLLRSFSILIYWIGFFPSFFYTVVRYFGYIHVDVINFHRKTEIIRFWMNFLCIYLLFANVYINSLKFLLLSCIIVTKHRHLTLVHTKQSLFGNRLAMAHCKQNSHFYFNEQYKTNRKNLTKKRHTHTEFST